MSVQVTSSHCGGSAALHGAQMQVFPGRVSYFLILAIALTDFIWMRIANITFPAHQLILPVLIVGVLSSVGLVVDRMTYSDARTEKIVFSIGYLFQGIIFLELSWIFIRLFDYVTMTTAFPYADSLLIGWDKVLGLDWGAYFRFVEDHSLVRDILGDSYTTLSLVSFVSFLLLIFMGTLKRTRYFLEVVLFTAIICTAIGMFFPAKAAVAMYYGDATTLANLTSLPGVYHIEHLERLRSGGPILLDLNHLPGLVTFPSFHTAAGIVLAISFWRTRLFPVALPYSLVMIAATPVFGGHYFIDLIAGAAVAVLVASVFASLPFYKGLFARTDLAVDQAELRSACSPAHRSRPTMCWWPRRRPCCGISE